MRQLDEPPEPWRSFFAYVDSHLNAKVELHCWGGFVITQLFGVARTTNDVDYLSAVPDMREYLTELAGRGSVLHRTHKVYFDALTVATPPASYEERLCHFSHCLDSPSTVRVGSSRFSFVEA